MPKFVLIDHSICDLTGHHYEYADHVLKAAAGAGYEPVLATNRSFRTSSTSRWRIFPIYEFGFWTDRHEGRWGKFLRSKAKRAKGLWFAARCRLRYSHFGLALLARTDWSRYLLRKPASASRLIWHWLGAAFLVSVKLGRLVKLILIFPFVMLLVPVLAVSRFLYSFQPVRTYFQALGAELRTYPDFVLTAAGSARMAVRRRWERRLSAGADPSQRFARDTATLFQRLPLSAGDVVFFPTLSHRDALGLLEFFRSSQPNSGISWHLLFRRDLYGARRRADARLSATAAEVRQALKTVRKGIGARKVHFYTDSDQLTEQYNGLGTFRFTTLPIPHTHPGTPARSGPPLQVTYLGDARKEKGYHMLPRIVGDFKRDCLQSGKIRFVIQSNYNVPGGEPAAVIARTQLESFPSSAVTLYKEALSPEQYRNLLLSADILLLPYDRTNYYSRSSGILVEALAAGIPAVVPAGTWLSHQLLKAGSLRYLSILRSRMEVLQSHLHLNLSWYLDRNSEQAAILGEKLEVSLERRAYCWVDVPEGTTHLLVSARFERDPHEGHLKVTEMNDEPLGPTKRLYLQGDDNGDCAVVLPLQSDAHKLCLALGSNAENDFISFDHLKIDFLAAPAGKSVPLGVAGLAYHDIVGIPNAIREIVDHYEHYRSTAGQSASSWRRFHNADRLVVEITRNAGQSEALPSVDTGPRMAERTLV